MKSRAGRVMAVASGGGHWVELMRLMPAFEGADMAFVTVNRSYRSEIPRGRFYCIRDATRWNKVALLWMAFQLLVIFCRERPRLVVTTGAAPGYFAMRLGKVMGARTIWVDSIANVDEMSLSGKMAGPYADAWLTQWPHLAGNGRAPHHPEYAGAVL